MSKDCRAWQWRRWESNSRELTRSRRFSNGFADRVRGEHVQRTRAKRVTGHSYDNVTNPGCESGARGGRSDVRGVSCCEVEAAWREEIARRVKSLEDGTAVLHDWDEVNEEISSILKGA